MISVSFKITCLSNIFRAPTVSVVFSKKTSKEFVRKLLIKQIVPYVTGITNLAKFFRNSFQLCISYKNLTSLYKNRKFRKFVTMVNISHKVLIKISQKLHFCVKKFLQKLQCVISTENSFKTVTFVQFCIFF